MYSSHIPLLTHTVLTSHPSHVQFSHHTPHRYSSHISHLTRTVLTYHSSITTVVCGAVSPLWYVVQSHHCGMSTAVSPLWYVGAVSPVDVRPRASCHPPATQRSPATTTAAALAAGSKHFDPPPTAQGHLGGPSVLPSAVPHPGSHHPPSIVVPAPYAGPPTAPTAPPTGPPAAPLTRPAPAVLRSASIDEAERNVFSSFGLTPLPPTHGKMVAPLTAWVPTQSKFGLIHKPSWDSRLTLEPLKILYRKLHRACIGNLYDFLFNRIETDAVNSLLLNNIVDSLIKVHLKICR